MPFKPGVSGNPGGVLATDAAATQPFDIPKDRIAKAENLRTDSFVIAKRIGQHIIADVERRGKKDWNAIRNKVWAWGVSADKVLQGAQDQPTTVNQVNLLFGTVAPAMQKAMLGSAFEVMQRLGNCPPVQIIENASQNDETPLLASLPEVIHNEPESLHNGCSATLDTQHVDSPNVTDSGDDAEK